MFDILNNTFRETFQILLLVFIMFVVMDLIYVYSRGRIYHFLQKHQKLQYFFCALLGATPGCSGAYLTVSLYSHGLISIGALLTTFIATTGDEAFIMIARFPGKAFLLFTILAVLGYGWGYAIDKIYKMRKWPHQRPCLTEMFHPGEEFRLKHYFGSHLWDHIIKKHMIKIFLWTFIILFILELIGSNVDLQYLTNENALIIILIAGLLGLIPQSGPNLIFVTMFAAGAIPFSFLFANMFVQSGHALLPLMSVTLKNSIIIKLIAFVLGITQGLIFFMLGF